MLFYFENITWVFTRAFCSHIIALTKREWNYYFRFSWPSKMGNTNPIMKFWSARVNNSLTYFFASKRGVRLGARGSQAKRAKQALAAVWPDGYIILQYWSFRTMKSCPKTWKICQSRVTIYSKNGKNIFKIVPKWRNLAKSGHTVWQALNFVAACNSNHYMMMIAKILKTIATGCPQSHSGIGAQCDQIGRFLKVLGDKIS